MELKNDIQIRGTLKSVDQYLNIKLDDILVMEELKYPHLVSTCFKSSLGSMKLTGQLLSRPSRMSSSEEAWSDMFIYRLHR